MIQPLRALLFNSQHDEASINLHANLVDYTEPEIAKALARHSVEIGLPTQGQENLIDKSSLDCEIYFTTILEKCADADILYKPRTKH